MGENVMTILASGRGLSVCGSLGCIQRVKGRRLPNGLGPYIGGILL